MNYSFDNSSIAPWACTAGINDQFAFINNDRLRDILIINQTNVTGIQNVTALSDDVVDYCFQLYCLAPPSDTCNWGYCPNPDVTGVAVRLATYAINFFSAIVLLYTPIEDKDTRNTMFYVQFLSVLTFVLATVIASNKGQLTRLHAVFALCAASSPLSLYFVIHAVMSMFGVRQRLSGKKREDFPAFEKGYRLAVFNRAVVFVMTILWLYAFITLNISGGPWHLQQPACDKLYDNLFLEILLLWPIALPFGDPKLALLIIGLPVFLLLAMWAFAIIRQGKNFYKGNSFWAAIVDAYTTVAGAYPIIEFYTFIIFPFYVWVFSLELGAQVDMESFTPSYGQLLALFTSLVPIFQVIVMIPRFLIWLSFTPPIYPITRVVGPVARRVRDRLLPFTRRMRRLRRPYQASYSTAEPLMLPDNDNEMGAPLSATDSESKDMMMMSPVDSLKYEPVRTFSV